MAIPHSRRNRHLNVTIASAANDDNPMNAGFAWGGEVLEGGFGGDGEDLHCGLEADDTFEGRDGVLAVGRNEFRDLVLWHALLLKDRIRQLLADFVGHLNDHADRICHAGFLHPLHHIRRVVIQKMATELFGLFGNASFHGSARRSVLDVVGSSLGILRLIASLFHLGQQIEGYSTPGNENGPKFRLETSGRSIDAVHDCGALWFLWIGLGGLSGLLLRFWGLVRVVTSAVGHDLSSLLNMIVSNQNSHTLTIQSLTLRCRPKGGNDKNGKNDPW